MIKFIIRCIKQALFGKYTIETSSVKPGVYHYGLFEGIKCLETSDNKKYLESYLKTYIKNKKERENIAVTSYYDRDGNKL